MPNQVSCSCTNCGCKTSYDGSADTYSCGNCGNCGSNPLTLTSLSSIAARVASVGSDFSYQEDVRVALRKNRSKKKKTSKKKKPTSKKKKTSKKRRVSEPEEKLFDPDQYSVDIEENMLRPKVEYSCRMEFSISVDFEGQVPKERLVKKLKSEMVAAMKAGVNIVSRDFSLENTGVKVQPIKVECAVNSD